jgi:hypothetical protein
LKESIVLRRILGIEKKKRRNIHTALEEELLNIIRKEGLDLANIINIGVEKVLREKGLL